MADTWARLDALPRKSAPDPSEGQVKAECVTIWQARRPNDTFIGIIDYRAAGSVFYLAPCFGVDIAQPDGTGKGQFVQDIAQGNFPDDTEVQFNSTSARDATMERVAKSTIDGAYGGGNVCYVWLEPGYAGFDGLSHKALYRWVKAKGWSIDWHQAFGFAIQKDASSYYVRFASTLNERWGQETHSTFTDRVPKTTSYLWGLYTTTKDYSDREPRDLPKQWARFVEAVLARDLGLALSNAGGKFERIVSRDEHQTTKISRFPNPDLHLASPGSETTGNRLV